MMKSRVVSGLIAACMVCGVFSALPPFAKADSKTVIIENKEDFIEFAEQCTLDTWSQGKNVCLAADIDFSGSEFVPVPTFCGSFDGNGYTLSGISYDKKGSYKGVFRYVGKGGKVSDLNVNGKFLLSGSKSFLGGIVGENSGRIENCSFVGNLKGENVVGGIVGNNTDCGEIISCVSSGTVIGENSTGGIAGKNSGFVQYCTNNSAVNTVYEEKETDLSDIETDTAAIIEMYKNSEEENVEESILGHTDTGGIVGFSVGTVQGCVNNGAVGYKHIGYNVGGIAGRQSGYMLGCENYGFIQGRKDVGGIVGQAEPYVLLHVSESTLKDLRGELNSLNSMVNKFISDTDNLGDEARKHLDGISKYAKDAENSTESLINQGTDFADDNLAEINALSATLSDALTDLVPVFDNLETGGEDLATAIDALRRVLDEIDLYAPDLKAETDEICDALFYIESVEYDLKNAAKQAGKAIKELEEAVRFKNANKVKYAVSELSAAIKDMANAKLAIKDSIDKIEKILNTKPESFESIGINAQKIAENLKEIKNNTEIVINSLKTIDDSLDIIVSNTTVYPTKFESAAKYMKLSLAYLADAAWSIDECIDELDDALDSFTDKIEELNDELSEMKNNLSEAMDYLSYATEDITDAVGGMRDIISDLADDEPTEFVKLGDDFRNSSEELFDSLSGISSEIDGLKDTIYNEKEKISGDLTSVANQFNLVMNLLIDETERLKNGADSLADIVVDASDEDIASVRQGKIKDCKNSGAVEADRNTGGIAGNMAIEYSKDPEDDMEKPTTLNFTYRTKAVLQQCINDGKITGKKDCVGGIAGKAEIGTVHECENYGDTQSTGGNYVGGVVGKSDSTVRKCYAKNKLDGKRYVGGIAGKAETILSSCTIVNVNGDENLGAVCGDGDKDKLHNNFYINNGIGALDGISYNGRCEAVSFDEMKNINGVPPRFISFTVTFVADGKTVETLDIKYGDETKRIKFPEIPEKDGHFGKWAKIEAETVTENITVECEYLPYITILPSNERNENGKLALALAEGEFTDSAELSVAESETEPPISKAENVKVYDISLTDADVAETETVTVRLLNENKDKVTVWQLKNGEWERIKTGKKGKYSTMRLAGAKNTVCVRYDKSAFAFGWIIAAAAIAIVAFAVLLVKKKRKITA